MKLIAICLILIPFSGCTITIKPIPATPQSRHKGKLRHHRSLSHHPVTLQPPSPNIKEGWWYENYKKLETEHGDYTISDDSKIEPLPDGRFKVPDTVLAHYQDLLLAKPSPEP